MPFWVERWLTSPDVRMMSFAERGLYLEMLAWSWIMGPLPADPKRLARLLGADVQEIEGPCRRCCRNGWHAMAC